MKRIIPVAAGCVIGAGAVLAEVAPTEVQFDEYGSVTESLTGVPGDPAAGAAILSNRGKGNCIACHAVTDLMDQPFHGEVGPPLDGAADRWDEAQLRGLIVNAKMMFDGTVMPAFYWTTGFNRPGDAFTGRAATEINPLLTAQEVEDVVAYLMTLSDG